MTAHIFHSLLHTVSPLSQLFNSSLQSRESQHRLKETTVPPASLSTVSETILVVNRYQIPPQEGTGEG